MLVVTTDYSWLKVRQGYGQNEGIRSYAKTDRTDDDF